MSLPSRSTLDLKHKEQLSLFQHQRQNLSQLQEQLDQLTKQKADLETQREQRELSLIGYQQIKDLADQITKLNNEIAQIGQNKQEYHYLLKTGSLVHEYFEQVQKRNTRDSLRKSTPKRDLNHYFKRSITEIDHPYELNNESDRPFQRADYNDRYLSQIDPNYLSNDLDIRDPAYCYQCKCYKDLDRTEAKLTCIQCGAFENEALDSDKPNYSREQSTEISNFAYKRINHFNEILCQSQATENTDIPQEVYDTVVLEMHKERCYNLAELDSKRVRNYLKKYRDRGYNKYYEHIPHIINRLNGIPPQKFSPIQEENLRNLFKRIQPTFEKHCPKRRNNFLSYNYIIYKFCELLGYDEFLENFPLLKSDNKLRDQEAVWKKICHDMEFQFIPTI